MRAQSGARCRYNGLYIDSRLLTRQPSPTNHFKSVIKVEGLLHAIAQQPGGVRIQKHKKVAGKEKYSISTKYVIIINHIIIGQSSKTKLPSCYELWYSRL